MEITLKSSGTFYELKVTAENVNMTENITETEYAIKEDGKIDYSKVIVRDIENSTMDQFSGLMEDLIYYRERPYDSTNLLRSAFEKLPEDKQIELLKELNRDYGE